MSKLSSVRQGSSFIEKYIFLKGQKSKSIYIGIFCRIKKEIMFKGELCSSVLLFDIRGPPLIYL